MSSTTKAIVIGGGIAGPATAMALRRAGIDPVVYEAHPTSSAGVGAFLTLASNGVDALRVIGPDPTALTGGFPTPGITLRSSTGRRLGESRTGGTLPDGTTSQTVRRDDLYAMLRAEASDRGVRIEHGKRLVAAERSATGVRAVFADGTEALGDVLIGCDGLHSTVRRLIDPAAPAPTYSGLITTGGYARGVRVDVEPGTYEMIFGKLAFFGYVVAPDGEAWWFANLPRRREPARGELDETSAEDWRRRLGHVFAQDAGPATALIEATETLMPMWPIHAIPHLPAWHDDRMVVLGDAAHAPSPTSGQGASLAIEDAVVLAQCLRDHRTPADAFARFEVLRRPRAEGIIRWASRINSSKAAGPVGRRIRDAMLPPILRLTADNAGLRRAYDHHLDWDASTAA